MRLIPILLSLLISTFVGNAMSTPEGGYFEDKITPATGAPTTLVSNAAGAKVLHQYAAGVNPQSTWLPGGLLESVSLGRGGATLMAYSNDGARDLESVTWPTVFSAGFGQQPFYGGSVGFPQRDAGGNIRTIIDPSGTRSLDYEKNRLTTTDWLTGELGAYKVVRQHDDHGRLEWLEVHRNDAAIHRVVPAYTGLSGEISGVADDFETEEKMPGFTAGVTRDETSRHVTGFTRGPVTQRWTRGTAGRITGADTNSTVNGAPTFSYTNFDNRARRKTVNTNKGTWTYGYRGDDTGDGQLVSATSTGNQLANFSYSVDGIGRRNFGNNQQDALNRFLVITHPLDPKNIYISAAPTARLWINDIEAQQFDGVWTQPITHPGAQGGWVPWHVKGVLEGAGDPGAFPDAVAEFGGHLWFPPATEEFEFDADGNREGSSLWDYGWDGRNKLVRARTKEIATAPEGWDLSFDYDAEGRRFKKTVTRFAEGQAVDHKVIHFVWDGWNLLFERHEDIGGNPLKERRYVWGPDIADGAAGGAGGLLLIRETRGQTTTDYYPIYDGTGHVVGLTDSAGNLAAEYWYGPFGELIKAQGEMANANPWRYATKYFDVETGLYYFGHRYYDPVTGQFLSRDPLGESESINLYAYCHNDPVNHVDVLGLASTSLDGSILTSIESGDISLDFIYRYFEDLIDAGSASAIDELSESTFDPIGYSDRRSGTISSPFEFPRIRSGWLEVGAAFTDSIYRPTQDFFNHLDSQRYNEENSEMLLGFKYMNASSYELAIVADSSYHSLADSGFLMHMSKKLSNREHQWSIISGTGTGLAVIVDLAIPAPPVFTLGKAGGRGYSVCNATVKGLGSRGVRNTADLTDGQWNQLLTHVDELGMNRADFLRSTHISGYSPNFDRVFLGPNTFTATTGRLGGTVFERLSPRAVVAHESGHLIADRAGRGFAGGSLLDEVQASLVGRSLPGLNRVERYQLLRDAAERARRKEQSLRSMLPQLNY